MIIIQWLIYKLFSTGKMSEAFSGSGHCNTNFPPILNTILYRKSASYSFSKEQNALFSNNQILISAKIPVPDGLPQYL